MIKTVGRCLFLSLDVLHEALRGLEGGDVVLGDDDGGVLGYVAGCLLGAGLDDEAAEAAEEHGLAVGQGVLNDFHELLDGFQNSGSFDAGCL